MTLLDYLSRTDTINANRVRGHLYENSLKLYFHGHITRTQMINLFSIPVGFESDFDQFLTRYESFASNNVGRDDRQNYVQDVEACLIAIQGQDITKAQFNTFTGLSLDET